MQTSSACSLSHACVLLCILHPNAGAGRNIAEVVARLGVTPVALVTALGDDWAAKGIAQHCASQLGVHVFTPQASATSTGGPPASAATSQLGHSATPSTLPPSSASSASTALSRTPVYSALLDEAGELVAAVADMDAFDALTPAAVLHSPVKLAAAPPSPAAAAAAAASAALSQASSFGDMLRACQTYGRASAAGKASSSINSGSDAAGDSAAAANAVPVIVLDANVPTETLRAVCQAAASPALVSSTSAASSGGSSAAGTGARASASAIAGTIPILFEPISVAKCVRIVDADALHAVSLIKPNRHEAIALASRIRTAMGLPDAASDDAGLEGGDADGASKDDASDAVVAERDSASVRKVFLPDAKTGQLVDSATETVITDVQGRQSRTVEGAAPAAASAGDAGAAGSGARGKWSEVAQGLSPLTGPQDAAESAIAAALAPSPDTDGANSVVNYGLLTAAQTILSTMVRPGPLAGHSSSQQMAPVLEAAVRDGAIAALQEVKKQIAREAESDDVSASELELEPATVDGRKHVLVTVGAEGVLWLSAPPTPSHHIADLMASLPFFMAAAHPALDMDFKLLPAATVDHVAKVTGAGDSFAGSVVASLARGCGMETAVRHGLAAAKLAIETEPGAASQSTISPKLSWRNVVQAAASSVQPISTD